jgi:hypothetical protein
MSFVALLLILIVIGVALYCLQQDWLPLGAPIKKIITIVCVIVAVCLCLEAFGVFDALRGVKVPRVD